MPNIIDIPRLAQLVRAKRGAMNLRDVSGHIKQGASVSPSTLSRLENGHEIMCVVVPVVQEGLKCFSAITRLRRL